MLFLLFLLILECLGASGGILEEGSKTDPHFVKLLALFWDPFWSRGRIFEQLFGEYFQAYFWHRF